jgi:hypothetical protein
VHDPASSYHIVDYNQENGKIIYRRTGQGYADWSTWSRGQAWGTYGFTTSKCDSIFCEMWFIHKYL